MTVNIASLWNVYMRKSDVNLLYVNFFVWRQEAPTSGGIENKQIEVLLIKKKVLFDVARDSSHLVFTFWCAPRNPPWCSFTSGSFFKKKKKIAGHWQETHTARPWWNKRWAPSYGRSRPFKLPPRPPTLPQRWKLWPPRGPKQQQQQPPPSCSPSHTPRGDLIRSSGTAAWISPTHLCGGEAYPDLPAFSDRVLSHSSVPASAPPPRRTFRLVFFSSSFLSRH